MNEKKLYRPFMLNWTSDAYRATKKDSTVAALCYHQGIQCYVIIMVDISQK